MSHEEEAEFAHLWGRAESFGKVHASSGPHMCEAAIQDGHRIFSAHAPTVIEALAKVVKQAGAMA